MIVIVLLDMFLVYQTFLQIKKIKLDQKIEIKD